MYFRGQKPFRSTYFISCLLCAQLRAWFTLIHIRYLISLPLSITERLVVNLRGTARKGRTQMVRLSQYTEIPPVAHPRFNLDNEIGSMHFLMAQQAFAAGY